MDNPRSALPVLLAAVAIAGGAALYYGGADGVLYPFGADNIGVPYAFMPALAVMLAGVARTPVRVGRAVAEGNEWLAPMGLEIREIPRSRILPVPGGRWIRHDVVGDTVIGGVRNGREVTVTLTSRGSVVEVGDIRIERRGGAGTQQWLADLEEAEARAQDHPRG